MAQIHSKPLPNKDEASEVKAFDALSRLGSKWHIFHSVAWIGLRDRRVGDGEADFVLLHEKFGAIVVEVKGGGIAVESGKWSSTGRHGTFEIKDPYRQATASKTTLHKWFKKQLGLKIPTAHCVLFPDYSDLGSLGPHAPAEITITPRDFDSIEDKLNEVVATWRLAVNLTSQEIRQVVQAISPTTSARRTLADEAYDAHRSIITLTEEQKRAFGGLRRNRRAVVFGGAGTGKTILAMEKAAEFEELGGNVLLVCFNRLLSLRLRSDQRLKRTKIATFHGLCHEMISGAGMEIPSSPPTNWWHQEAAEQLVDALSENETSFDAIVVDEGQDFSASWISALEVAGAHGEETPFYIFADENQNLWPRDWMPEASWPVFELSINCRNTEQIAKRIEHFVPNQQSVMSAQGPEPKWTDLTNKSRTAITAVRAVDRLLNEGFSPKEICVLCEHKQTAEVLHDMTASTSGFGTYESPEITVETIARFKGLEAPAVVVVLENEQSNPDTTSYVGFSRATTYLQVIGPPSRKRAIQWS